MSSIINIIVSVLAIAINSLLAISVFGLIYSFYKFNLDFFIPYFSMVGITLTKTNVPLATAILVMTVLILLSLSPFADSLLRALYGFRKPLNDEVERLNYLFNSVCCSAKKNPKDYQVYIIDEKSPNAYALGSNSIGITRMLLNNFSDAEIKGVIAHELGHINYKDSVHTKIFMTVTIFGQCILILYKVLAVFFGGLARIPIPFVNIFFLLINWVFSLQVWFFELLLVIPLSFGKLFGSRRCEYRADRYAYEIGEGEGLYSFLYKILDMNYESNGFFKVLRSTHPATAERIRKIDKLQKEVNFSTKESSLCL